MTPILLFVALLQATTPPSAPLDLVRELQHVIDRDGGAALEASWRARLARAPRDRRAILAVATFERERYRYERADSLYRRLLDTSAVAPSASAAATNAFVAVALQGMAAWRALGTAPAQADWLLVRARDEARRSGVPSLEAEVVLALAQLRQRTRGPRFARQLLEEWWSLLRPPSALDSAQRLCVTGAIDEQLGDTTGIRRLQSGAAIASRLQSWRIAGTCKLLVAQTADRRGYREGAVPEARRALADFERVGHESGVALASQWLGYLELQRGQYATSRLLLERAIRAARLTRFESVEAWARGGLAELHLTLGDPAAARAQAARAAASHRRRNDRWGMAVALAFEATALESAGELQGARDRLSDAIQAYAVAGLPLHALSAYAHKARVEMRLGLLDAAAHTLDSASAIGGTTEGWLREAPVHRADLAMRRGRFSEADSLLRGAAASAAWRDGDLRLLPVMVALREARVSLRLGRSMAADSAVAAVTLALQQWRGRAMNADITGALAQLRDNWGRLSDLYPDLIDQMVRHDRLDRAFEFVEQVRAREIVERRLQGVAVRGDSVRRPSVEGQRSTVVSLAALREALATHEAFVAYVLGVDHEPSTALVVTRGGVRGISFPGRAALVADIDRVVQLAAVGVEAVAESRRLGSALLAPVFAVLPPEVHRVMLSPDGELFRVPFDALRLADGRFAVERFTLSLVPSATSALALRTPASAAGVELLAVGDPRFAAPSPSRAPRDLAREPGSGGFGELQLPRLPASRAEALRVASYGVRTELLVGPDANEASLRRLDWSRFGVAHFATHALVDPESQSRTALAVSPDGGRDGYLTPDELAALPLRSPLVVLSACRSIGGQVLPGEGLRGLAAPLLEAGARAIVATHWSIDDRRVVPIIDRFYAAMATGVPVDAALRLAKLAAIREGVSIADWAGFAVIGDGSMLPRLRPIRRPPIAWVRTEGAGRREPTAH